MFVNPAIQSYPPPTELPAMRAGETDARYMDCSTALAPVSDVITDVSTVSVVVSRRDCQSLTVDDLQPAPSAWDTSIDATGQVVTMGWTAPLASAGITYLLTLTISPTYEGRTFIRDWYMSILPLMG